VSIIIYVKHGCVFVCPQAIFCFDILKGYKNWKNPSPGTQGYKSEKGLYLTIEG